MEAKYITGYCVLLLTMICRVSLAEDKLDNSQTYTEAISKNSPIHVHLFSTADTDLGRPKFRDTANAMAKSAPHLLASDIVNELRESGFTEVSLDETEGEPSADSNRILR